MIFLFQKPTVKTIADSDSDISLNEGKDILILSMRDYVAEKLRIARDTHFDIDKELNKVIVLSAVRYK